MSMTTNAGEGWSGYGRFPYWGNRSRISWGAVFAGAAVATTTSLVLSLLGAAFGGPVADTGAASGDLARTAGVWEVIALALAMAAGGYVAARLSGTHSHLDGELHGITMWAVAVLIGVFAFARLFGALGAEVGPAIGAAVSQNASSALGAVGANPERLVDRLSRSLGASGDPTTMSHDQIAAEIRDLTGQSLMTTGATGAFSAADRDRLIALVAAQYGVTRDEATQRVTRMEDEAKARATQLREAARADADAAVQAASTAARALFPALVLGLLGALVGSWLGTRHKHILHPHEREAELAATHGYVVHEPASGYAVQPSSLSVYDDTGRLVSQYLRGVSFPVTKQELVRFARSSNAGPTLIHSIEGLADRSYVSANDVLGALGAV
jgi:Protein of unknown function (DUF2795)